MAYLSPYFVVVKLIDFSKLSGRLTHYFLRGQKSTIVRGLVYYGIVVLFCSPKTRPSMMPNRTSTTVTTKPPIIFLFLYQTSAYGSFYTSS